MRNSVIIVLLLLSLNSGAQVITGTVFDQKTREAVVSASVYFNGTIGGTLTDVNGKFRLDVSKYVNMPLTISALGYFSATLADYRSGKPIEVFLAPKTFQLDEVVVKAKSHSWERRESLEIFRREFLGATSNSFSCKIMNEEDIKFRYDTGKDTIRAFAVKPLRIENNALGYIITYYLDYFEFSKTDGSFSFKGNAIFNEDTTATDSRKIYFEKKRSEAYSGSRMQFFRALWMDNLNAAGFTVKNSANETLSGKNIVYTNGRLKYLRYPGTDLGIGYYSKIPSSFIVFKKDLTYFDGNGYFEPSAIIWEGDMSKKRIADLLPFDYIPRVN
jgi:CarboxypepD_reg-like domain